jgi:hypothetical protein
MNDPTDHDATPDRAIEIVTAPEPAVPAEPAPGGEPAEPVLEAGTAGETREITPPEIAPPEIAPPAAPEPVVEAGTPDGLPEPVAETPIAPPAETSRPKAPAADAEPVEISTLVPLDDIAPAIVAASVTRRAFLGFGLALAGGLAGAAVLSRLFPIFEDTANAASPIVPTYDPVGKAWTFVVDTSVCIGCGLCVVAC